MAITQKWHTSRGTACDTERAATIRENAEILADDAHKQVPGIPVKLAADLLTLLMTEGKLTVPRGLPADDTDFDTLREAFHQLTRYGAPFPGIVEAVDKLADMNDDMEHGREPCAPWRGTTVRVEWA